ncbi:MAG TPA: SOS response-associated peptidase family protein [Chitinophagaceae bacterium]|jgi:putative SOS response-associated peptidase YedK|nr:SOS response-associated peptidase family protein [Chitinophagaceae bacterium]
MCYDVSYEVTFDMLADYFGDIIIDEPELEIDFTVGAHVIGHSYSKQRIVLFDDGVYKAKRSEWGLIAGYMNTPEKIKKARPLMLNARSEKILGDRSSVWYRIRHQRCLIPVRGIYEHRAIKGWKNKVPYLVRQHDRDMFCLPGLWNYSPIPNPETGEVVITHTIITRGANSVMRQIHNDGDNAFRMPLFLPKDLETEWLDPNLSDEVMQEILDFEMPSEELDTCPVFSIRTTKPHPTGGKKTDFYDWPNLPPLGKDDGELQKTLF